jgi:hypothetical protein
VRTKINVIFQRFVDTRLKVIRINTTGSTSGAGTASSSVAPKVTLVFSWVRVAPSLVFCVVYVDHSFPFVLFRLAIVLSVLRLTASDNPFAKS